MIGAYYIGKLITNGKMGPELSEYGMKPKKININKLCNIIRLEKAEELKVINTLAEVDVIEQTVEECLSVPLDLDFDSVKADEKYMEEFSNERYRVFSRC